jgi:type VI secretion system protein ImpB
LKGTKPRIAFRVDNKLTNDDTKMGVELRFNSLDDFEPEQVVKQVEPLRKLLEIRRQLSGLLAKTDGNDPLSEQLQSIITNTELLQRIGKEAGVKIPESQGEANSATEEASDEQ